MESSQESSRKRGRGDAEGNDEAAARAASFVAPTKKARRAALEAAKQPAGLTVGGTPPLSFTFGAFLPQLNGYLLLSLLAHLSSQACSAGPTS